ncbi:hypothetical protein V8F20_008198 [Naviculisporaceae sp. PSN 640]
MGRLLTTRATGGRCMSFIILVHVVRNAVKSHALGPTQTERSPGTRTLATDSTSTITSTPSSRDSAILRRALASDTICGWKLGKLSSPIACTRNTREDESCAFINSKFVGCCDTASCSYYTTCHDGSVYEQLPDFTDHLALVCTQTVTTIDTIWSTPGTADLTECVQHIWSTGAGFEAISMTSWSCGSRGSFNYVDTTAILDPVSVNLPHLAVSGFSIVSTVSEKPTPSTTSLYFSAIPTIEETPEGSGTDMSMVGAIIGGVVGVVVILIFLGFGIYCLRRHSTNDRTGRVQQRTNEAGPRDATPLMVLDTTGKGPSVNVGCISHPMGSGSVPSSAINLPQSEQERTVVGTPTYYPASINTPTLASSHPIRNSPVRSPSPSGSWVAPLSLPRPQYHSLGGHSPTRDRAPSVWDNSEIGDIEPSPQIRGATLATDSCYRNQAYMGSGTGIDRAFDGSV